MERWLEEVAQNRTRIIIIHLRNSNSGIPEQGLFLRWHCIHSLGSTILGVQWNFTGWKARSSILCQEPFGFRLFASRAAVLNLDQHIGTINWNRILRACSPFGDNQSNLGWFGWVSGGQLSNFFGWKWTFFPFFLQPVYGRNFVFFWLVLSDYFCRENGNGPSKQSYLCSRRDSDWLDEWPNCLGRLFLLLLASGFTEHRSSTI